MKVVKWHKHINAKESASADNNVVSFADFKARKKAPVVRDSFAGVTALAA